MTLQPNTLLQGGKYKIVRFLSSGGFGNTYEGVHTMMDTRVAIKEFFPKMFCNRDENTSHVTVATQGNRELVDKLRKKFNEEAKAIFQMNHPNIVRVLDIFEENGTAYYVMEYIDGKSLNEITKERGALPEAEAVGYIRQVADALKYVHSLNRLHLDIKPGNIMIDRNGKAILIDFGASKHYDMDSGENTSTLMGVNTKGYAPIEQSTQSFTSFSPATDIYALGATLYKLLTGIVPPDANLLLAEEETLLPLPSAVSTATCNAVTSALSLKRRGRPQSVDDFLVLLDVKSKKKRASRQKTKTETHKALDEDTMIEQEPSKIPGNVQDAIDSSGREKVVSTNNSSTSKKSENVKDMIFVSTWNNNPDWECKLTIWALLLLSIGAFVPITNFIVNHTDFFGYDSQHQKIPMIGTYIITILFELGYSLLLLFPKRNQLLFKQILSFRKELLQTDLVERQSSKELKFLIVARKTNGHFKYGLFNVNTLRLIIPFKYDKMKWNEARSLLNVEINNNSIQIDKFDRQV